MDGTISAAVNRMTITIGHQLSTDMKSALRRVDDEMTRTADKLNACEERLKEVEQQTVNHHAPSQHAVSHQSFDINRLEQYSRRENIRMRGGGCQWSKARIQTRS